MYFLKNLMYFTFNIRKGVIITEDPASLVYVGNKGMRTVVFSGHFSPLW